MKGVTQLAQALGFMVLITVMAAAWAAVALGAALGRALSWAVRVGAGARNRACLPTPRPGERLNP